MQGKYQHPVQSTHLPSPPKTWSTNYLGPGVEQSQAFTKSKLLTCTYFLSTTGEYSEDVAHTFPL